LVGDKKHLTSFQNKLIKIASVFIHYLNRL